MDRIAQEAYARQRMLEYFLKHRNATETTIRYKVSRKTLYKWLKRYDGTWQSLVDRSRRPHNFPRAHSDKEIRQIRRLAKKYMWTDLIRSYQDTPAYEHSDGYAGMANSALPVWACPRCAASPLRQSAHAVPSLQLRTRWPQSGHRVSTLWPFPVHFEPSDPSCPISGQPASTYWTQNGQKVTNAASVHFVSVFCPICVHFLDRKQTRHRL